MKQAEKHIIKKGHSYFDYCAEITAVSKTLYNAGQFTQRQGFFYGWGTQSQAKLDVILKENEH